MVNVACLSRYCRQAAKINQAWRRQASYHQRGVAAAAKIKRAREIIGEGIEMAAKSKMARNEKRKMKAK